MDFLIQIKLKTAPIQWLTAMLFPWAIAVSFAQISPGKLSKAHAALDGIQNCTRCHTAGKRVSSEKCLSCHASIRSRINAEKGIHRRKTHSRCDSCHIEHHGRDFDLVYWKGGRESFDHARTGFPLEGSHSGLNCRSCHRPEFIQGADSLAKGGTSLSRTYLGLKPDCSICHEDPHGGGAKRNCISCHDLRHWKPASRFRHDSTRFALTGRHLTLSCRMCHALRKNPSSKKYPESLDFSGNRSGQCIACHKDVHEGRLGSQCLICHTTAGWDSIKQSAFQHDVTGFPLKGRHASLKCNQCHRPGFPLKRRRNDRCADCHPDRHLGRFLTDGRYADCSDCHSVEGFSPTHFTLSRHANTGFPLTGAHLAVPCNACHAMVSMPDGLKTPRFDFGGNRCKTCHTDPHQGQLERWIQIGGCEICHTSSGWKNVRFDHNQTRFRIDGRHGAVPCASCHLDSLSAGGKIRYRFLGTSMNCQSCHQDVHRGQFIEKTTGTPTTRCDRCHTTVDWLAEKFDHNRDSAFPLTGSHRSLPCAKCHLKAVVNGNPFIRYKPMPHQCDSCHGRRTSTLEGGTR